VTTRWYRAPELLCLSGSYGFAVDIWSVGCIIAEMLGRKPLFAGKDQKKQLKLILELLGRPSPGELMSVLHSSVVQYLETLPEAPSTTLEELLPSANPVGIDLVRKLLYFAPSSRLTASQALQHPYLSAYFDEESQRQAEEQTRTPEHLARTAQLSEWLTMTGSLSKEQLQNFIFHEMLHFHPEAIHLHWGVSHT